MAQDSDEELLARFYRNAEIPALETFIQRHMSYMTKQARYFVRREDTEDIVQSSVIRLMDAKPRNGIVKNAIGWWHSMLASSAIDHLRSIERRRKRERVFFDSIERESNDVESDAIQTQLLTQIRSQTAQLDSKLSDPLVMRYFMGMTYQEIARCDCGSQGNPRFPEQEKMKVSKPLLSEVIKTAEHHIKGYTQYEVDYNIELKSNPKGDNQFHPTPEEFSRLVYALIDQYLPFERVVIQSFDFRILQYWHKYYPEVRLAALIENTNTIGINLASLGFKPDIYSSYHKLLSRKKVQDLHLRSIKVIPWTVNEPKQMKKLVSWGVDGLITDYPDRAKALGLTLDVEPKP